MIKQLFIKNFQSHKNTSLNFHKGVNIIMGTSDSGKSAIIRALKWIIWNRPMGDSMRSNWGGDTEVSIILDKEITRKKTKKDNYYTIEDNIFTAFKSDPPKEIIDILNLDEINLQQQLDTPFLLSRTPGEISQYFNKISNLEQIDKSIKYINLETKKLQNTIIFKNQELGKINEELNDFQDLDKLEIEIQILEELETQKLNKTKNKNNLTNIIESLDIYENEIIKFSKILKILKPTEICIKLLSQKQTKLKQNIELNNIIDNIKNKNIEITNLKNIINLKNKIDFIINLYNIKKENTSKMQKLISELKSIDQLNTNITHYKKIVKKLKIEFKNNFPDKCPLCGSLK